MKQFKRTLAIALVFVMVISILPMSVFAVETPTIKVSNATGKAGDEVTVTVEFANNPGFFASTFSVSYDETRLEKVEYITNSTIGVTWTTQGNNFLFENQAMEDTTYNGQILELKFKIKEDAPAGDAEVKIVNWLASDIDMNQVDFESVPGKVTVEAEEVEPVVAKVNGEAADIQFVDNYYNNLDAYLLNVEADAKIVTLDIAKVNENWNLLTTDYAEFALGGGNLPAGATYADGVLTIDLTTFNHPCDLLSASDYGVEEREAGQYEVYLEHPSYGTADFWSYAILINQEVIEEEPEPVVAKVDGEAADIQFVDNYYNNLDAYLLNVEADAKIVTLDIAKVNENWNLLTTDYAEFALGGGNLPAGATYADGVLTIDLTTFNHPCDLLSASDYGVEEREAGQYEVYLEHPSYGTADFWSYAILINQEVIEEEPVAPGYTFATSADVTAENDGQATVHVKVSGHSNPEVTSYNAYDITLTFDSTKLELVDYAGAVKNDGGSVTVNGNEIRIVGCGENKAIGSNVVDLIFKTKAEGAANVTVSKVQVSDKNESIKADAPEASAQHAEGDNTADETPDVSVVIVPYTVNKPDFISGELKVLHGDNYTFSYTDTTNYTYSDLVVKVGGTVVTPSESNGVYTITNVTGAVEITATQTPNSYDVTKPENVEGPDKATYGEDYIFAVTPSKDDMAIDTVKVTDKNGNEISYTINENGEYVIAGSSITGEFTITVTEKEKMTTIKFTGIEETEIEGGLTQAAEIGKDFTFKLIKQEEMDYIVKVGDKTLKEKDGAYTIPAELVVKGEVTVNIEKVDNSIPTVDVQKYIDLDGKVMFLVTAKWRDNVLAWGENTMFYSERYSINGEAGAYCWLVLSTEELNTVADVKLYALNTIKAAGEGATATTIKYNFDVNGTTVADVNDAQLVYDMYNAHYMDFTDDLPMLKFLEADVQTDMELNTQDVATIINAIVSGAMPA